MEKGGKGKSSLKKWGKTMLGVMRFRWKIEGKATLSLVWFHVNWLERGDWGRKKKGEKEEDTVRHSVSP